MANATEVKDFGEELRNYIDQNRGRKASIDIASPNMVRKLSDRWVNNKRTNVRAIKSVSKLVQYTIAAKMLGDNEFVNNVCEYVEDVCDHRDYADLFRDFFTDINIQDDCYDDFKTTAERLAYKTNKDVYEYIKSNKDYSITNSGYGVFITKDGVTVTLYADDTISTLESRISMVLDNKKEFESTHIKSSSNVFCYRNGKLYNAKDNRELIIRSDRRELLEIIKCYTTDPYSEDDYTKYDIDKLIEIFNTNKNQFIAENMSVNSLNDQQLRQIIINTENLYLNTADDCYEAVKNRNGYYYRMYIGELDIYCLYATHFKEKESTYRKNFRLSREIDDVDAAREYLLEPDMTDYLKDYVSRELASKITSIEWILLNSKQGYVELKTRSRLTADELDDVVNFVRGQDIDGLGEGFEQQDFGDGRHDNYASIIGNKNFYLVKDE